jgi:hypothetical protein
MRNSHLTQLLDGVHAHLPHFGKLAAHVEHTTEAPPGVLAEPNFRALWVANLFGDIGSNTTLVALSVTSVVLLDAGSFQVGVIAVLSRAAYRAMALPVGVRWAPLGTSSVCWRWDANASRMRRPGCSPSTPSRARRFLRGGSVPGGRCRQSGRDGYPNSIGKGAAVTC